jgi:hypothetical protein
VIGVTVLVIVVSVVGVGARILIPVDAVVVSTLLMVVVVSGGLLLILVISV